MDRKRLKRLVAKHLYNDWVDLTVDGVRKDIRKKIEELCRNTNDLDIAVKNYFKGISVLVCSFEFIKTDIHLIVSPNVPLIGAPITYRILAQEQFYAVVRLTRFKIPNRFKKEFFNTSVRELYSLGYLALDMMGDKVWVWR